jgi:RNA polymerase sigma-70 factor (ECF subfamily)
MLSAAHISLPNRIRPPYEKPTASIFESDAGSASAQGVREPPKPTQLFRHEGLASLGDSAPSLCGSKSSSQDGVPRTQRREPANAPSPCRTVELTSAQICEDYGARIYKLARWLAFNRCDAEDIAQEVFLQVVRKLATFRGESEFTTWLHRITINAAFGHRRRFRRTLVAIGPLEHYLGRGRIKLRDQPRPDHQAQTNELKREIDRAIGRLPKKYRQVFLLAVVNQLSLAHVANLLGVNLGAVKSRLHRARRLLRTYLTPYVEA